MNTGHAHSLNLLIGAALTTKTVKEYNKAVSSLRRWLVQEGYYPSKVAGLDVAIADYFLHLYLAKGGKGKQIAANVIAGVHFRIPETKGKLGRSYLALQGWRRLVPTKSHTPITWSLAVAVAASFVQQCKLQFAVATLLAFDAYLRVSEFTALERVDVADVHDKRLGRQNKVMCVRLKVTKTGQNQWVTVQRPEVAQLLRMRLAEIPKFKNSKIFDFTAVSFRSDFKATCSAMGLRGYVPHSLRHGGATHDYLAGVSMENIIIRGRWASNKSARTYIQAGKALLLDATIPTDVSALSKWAIANFRSVFMLSQNHRVDVG